LLKIVFTDQIVFSFLSNTRHRHQVRLAAGRSNEEKKTIEEYDFFGANHDDDVIADGS